MNEETPVAAVLSIASSSSHFGIARALGAASFRIGLPDNPMIETYSHLTHEISHPFFYSVTASRLTC